ncbi:phytoene desaturase family protein [Pseudosulfitobacter koreensis]|uniref:Pyridine nucleotide-disulfide oxidoreductase domain-containing protein 2 n=1 Tax=Pseudosulfitobacter koreensis TaxID=2968472 RepID=A0ABT1Z2X8_9RHOB|nr:NAD(P)/FAD-dependent oxidoreductase [Pseudosulfitobacter koreense]MCR8827490.1 NAD(P)/FAD-dependent oxidoreductase [Pseudosulfitobacter koreense]
MTDTYDAIVVGAGHNGLTAATVLARRGKRVCVVEKSGQAGGMARTVDYAEGARGPEIAHLLYNLSPKVAKDIALRVETRKLPTIAMSPDGKHVEMAGDTLRFADGTAHPEAEAYAALRKRLVKFARLLGQLSDAPPPSLAEGLAGLRDIGGLARLGLNVKRLGKQDMREFLRIILSNAYDLLLDDLADGPVAGALAADAVRGCWSGPRGPGSVFTLLYRLGQGGDVLLPMRGMGAFETAAKDAGVEMRTRSTVASVMVEQDQVRGVTLDDGTILQAAAVLSSLAAPLTMQLAGARHFDIEATRRLQRMRAKGTTAKLNLVLSATPDMPGLSDAQKAARLIVAPSATHVESAFNPVKYGEASAAPVLEAVLPSLSDPSLCKDGRQVISVIAQFVPHAPDGGWTAAQRDDLSKRIIQTLEVHMPGLQDLITHSTLLTPDDIETLTGAPGGHWHHGELSIDQLLTVRPVNGLSRYSFGVRGYYLCGASAHPGGDVTGSPGRNAALQLLAEGVLS